jgi:hypothetical protein
MVNTKEATGRATRRNGIAAVVIASLLIAALVTADLARGGRPDPPALRAASTLLAGTWRFRAGDDPRWADHQANDGDWETIDLTPAPGSHDGDVGLPDYVAGWMARGHPGYRGYAWYRRVVEVPAGHASWDILGPTLVDEGYELYWNGRLLGGSGRIGAAPRLVGTRPLRFALPANSAGTRGVLAIRAFMLPGSGASPEGGGLHTAPILAPRPVSDALHRAQWERTIAGYVVDLVEPLAMLALIALAYRSRSSGEGFVLFASIALAFMAERRLNNAIVAWTDVQDLRTYAWLASWMWVPAVAAWALAWNRWCARPWRSIDVLAVVLAVVAMVGTLHHAAGFTHGVRIAWLVLFAILAVRIARGGTMRVLALAALASIIAGMFGGELLDPLGVPGIWFPFNIGVSRTQYVYALVIPLLAALFVRMEGQRHVVRWSPGSRVVGEQRQPAEPSP